MTRRKPGIFDPWRQEAPAKKETRPAEEEVEVRHAVQFIGPRAGVTVWTLAGSGDADRLARARLEVAKLVRSLLRTPAKTTLESHGVTAGWSDGGTVVHIGREPHCVTIETHSGGDRTAERAIDILALALRDVLQQHPALDGFFSEAQVRPFIK